MSNILSYSNKTTKNGEEDWIPVEPYTDDDIAQIKDPDGGLAENPRTAIPSPFAQLDLVKNAFRNLANPQLRGAKMNERLVSNALDVAQLFFDFENHKNMLRIVCWNRDEEIARLKADPKHRLYGETLDLFLHSDRIYNFDLLTDWYIILWGGRVLGGTSPSSLVMAAPAASAIDDIKVEQGVALFSTLRPLWQRDDDFVFYLYLLFNAYPSLREHVGDVYAYMMANVDHIRLHKPELYRRITEVIPNLGALDRERAAAVLEQLEQRYDPFGGGVDVNILGARLYHKRATDIRTAAAASDFVIAPDLPQPAGTELPLVLVGGFNGSVDHFRYVDKQWDSATQVWADGVPMSQRILPDTSTQYPFLTTHDFLHDTIVRLNCAIDNAHFFDGNLRSRDPQPQHGYLLPLKPEFFNYFSVDYLTGTIAGRHVIEIEEWPDGSVSVTLRVRVKKTNRFIEFTRKYVTIADHTWTFDEHRGTGRVMDTPLSTAVFPFVRTGINDDYTVQLFTMIEDGGGELRFYANGMNTDGITESHKVRSQSGFTTTYYDINGSFDMAQATVNNAYGTFNGMIVPLWKPYAPSAKELIFAVDFGTTNTHVEWAEKGHPSQPVTFAYGEQQVLIASLHKPGTLDYAEQVQRVEFLPREINNVYGFPLRSALAANANSAAGTKLFHDLNIPFLYERQYFFGYDVTTNLKWMGNSVLAKEFLREIMLLIKAKALLENADLRRTEVIYFFPVSMGGNDRRQLKDAWEELFNTYMGGDLQNLHSYPESIAPAFYYSGAEVAGSSYVSIDIGGGTSDTVIYQPTPDRLHSVPVAISSFRFAGNAIFGDAFGDKDADNNPLLQHYTKYFTRLIGNDKGNNIGYLNSIMHDIMKQKRSEDINAFLFSIENVEELRNLRVIDRNLYSYNALLRNDGQRKLIFLYFYAAIIYYIASAMRARNFEMPKQIYFSGTGSKILNILGSREQINEFTQVIIERVFGKTYTERFEIKIENECPKQITCRGGIKLENQRLEGKTETAAFTARNVNAIKYCYSMIGNDNLTFDSVNQIETRGRIVQQVRVFNDFFMELCDKVTRDEFGIDNNVFRIFGDVVNDGIANFLSAGIVSFLQGRYEGNDVIEDVPFFYPIIGTIRHNLLKNLSNDVISHYNG